MNNTVPFYLHKLRSALDERCERNPAYSLRAFASFLELNPASLSSVLKGQRRIAKKSLSIVVDKLELSPKEKAQFIESHELDSLFTQETKDMSFQLNDELHFKVIAEWQHYAILSLFDTQDFPKALAKKDLLAWVAGRLSQPKQKIQACFENLQELALVKFNDEAWSLSQEGLSTTEDISSTALKKARRQDLDLAERALHEVDVELRDLSSITFTTDPNDLPKLKQKIRQFRKELSDLAESSAGQEVYKLNLQLFPLTKLNNKGENNDK